ncbi:MAG: hypothetical protein CMM77_15550 [Rhodospirillaceae bacterium]|nr:hypothetical protein [Rhodospirillaceae bacterium]
MSDDEDTEPALTPDAAERRVDRGMAMAARMDLDGALADFAAIDAALRFSKDPVARVQWARALNGLGYVDLMDAKEARAAVSEPDEETEDAVRWGLKQALARFEQALAVQTHARFRAAVTGNRAYALVLLGRTNDAREAFRRLFADGGREAYEGQVRDMERRPVPEDRAVRRMLDEIWEEMKP